MVFGLGRLRSLGKLGMLRNLRAFQRRASLSLNSLNSLDSLSSHLPIFPNSPPTHLHTPNLLLEWCRCGLDKEIAPDGTYLTYFPFGAMIERPQMTPYHKKLLCLVVRTKHINNLVNVKLLHIVTCWTQVLTWIELRWLLCKYLAYSSCHSKT